MVLCFLAKFEPLPASTRWAPSPGLTPFLTSRGTSCTQTCRCFWKLLLTKTSGVFSSLQAGTWAFHNPHGWEPTPIPKKDPWEWYIYLPDCLIFDGNLEGTLPKTNQQHQNPTAKLIFPTERCVLAASLVFGSRFTNLDFPEITGVPFPFQNATFWVQIGIRANRSRWNLTRYMDPSWNFELGMDTLGPVAPSQDSSGKCKV